MLNKHEIIGRLGNDPETRYLPSGDAVTNISVATTERWKDKQSGEMKEATEWHRVVFFGKLAEIAAQYLKKGALVYVCGRGETRKWQAQDGTDRYSYQIRGDEMKMLGSKQEGGDNGGGERRERTERQTTPGQPTRGQPAGGGFDEMDDDIPFN